MGMIYLSYWGRWCTAPHVEAWRASDWLTTHDLSTGCQHTFHCVLHLCGAVCTCVGWSGYLFGLGECANIGYHCLLLTQPPPNTQCYVSTFIIWQNMPKEALMLTSYGSGDYVYTWECWLKMHKNIAYCLCLFGVGIFAYVLLFMLIWCGDICVCIVVYAYLVWGYLHMYCCLCLFGVVIFAQASVEYVCNMCIVSVVLGLLWCWACVLNAVILTGMWQCGTFVDLFTNCRCIVVWCFCKTWSHAWFEWSLSPSGLGYAPTEECGG
jgi:hypothetical protein